MTKRKEPSRYKRAKGVHPPWLNRGRGTGPRKAYKEDKKAEFLNAYREIGFKALTCEAVGINIRTFEAWIKRDKAFAENFQMAEMRFTEILGRSAAYRGTKGVERPVFYKGKPLIDPSTGKPYMTRYVSDNLLMFVLKKRDPSYRDQINQVINVRVMANFIKDLVPILDKHLPSSCPHCGGLLDLKSAVVRDLEELSRRFDLTKAVEESERDARADEPTEPTA